MPLFVVTGGIGAGKSAVLDCWRRLGMRTAEADQIAHALYQPGRPAWQAIRERWGDQVLDATGLVSRATVADVVFRDPAELAWLNGLLHPLVRDEVLALVSASATPLFCAIPLYYEAGWSGWANNVIVVWCRPDIQQRRLQERGWNPGEIARRLSSQMSQNEKLARADFAIINDYSPEILMAQCQELLGQLAGAGSTIPRP
jgi:dephospho-CoA kinase